jgi:hypothetical protein
MASTFQQQALRRKLIYVVGIVVLFTLSIGLRQVSAWSLNEQARALEMREEDRGEVQLTARAINLMMTGSRGFVMTLLWAAALEDQKRNEWNDLENDVNSLTILQPHFITPWLFQSWNLSYNVSVESDRIRDKYFYITRGIELLARGERQNRNHPDIRFYMGFYNQHKIGLSDEANTLRCLYQMSCIDPLERDAERMRTVDEDGRQVVQLDKFEQFCRNHPMLVRRLREILKHETPNAVLEFLADNKDLPTRFDEKRARVVEGVARSPLKEPAEDRFPVLAPMDENDRKEGFGADPDAPDFDNFMVARDWYRYSLKPLPPPTTELGPRPPAYDPHKYRMPRYMVVNIFRGYPARGQSYVAEYVEKEGWFGPEGWKITGDWFPDNQFKDGQPAEVGAGPWAVPAWTKAHNMWTSHGEANGLLMREANRQALELDAREFMRKFNIQPGQPPPMLAPEDRQGPLGRGLDAYIQMYWYEHYRTMTNFPHFYFVSQVESASQPVTERQPPQSFVKFSTVDVRRDFFRAAQLRNSGHTAESLKLYMGEEKSNWDGALSRWRDVLAAHPDFRKDETVQEDSYEIELKVQEMLQNDPRHNKLFKDLCLLSDCQGQAVLGPRMGVSWIPSPYLIPKAEPPLPTPFLDKKGEPLIAFEVKMLVRSRLGLSVPAMPGTGPGQMPPQGMPPMPGRPGGGNMPRGAMQPPAK